VAFGREDSAVGLPEIAVADSTLSVDWRKAVPESLRRDLVACSDRKSDNLSSLSIQCEPEPLLIALTQDERPQLVAFQNQAPFFFGVTSTVRGTFAYLALT
jgi:hypothetical protein